METVRYQPISRKQSIAMSVLETGTANVQLPPSRTRLVGKTGAVNISHKNISQLKRRYLADMFTTILDIRWRYFFLIFAASFLLSWLVFALMWMLMSYVHGDFNTHEEKHWKGCIENTYDFTTILLFSMETQTTIGYGVRYVNDECPEGIFLVMFQSVFGALLQALLTGLVFVKVQKAKKRAQTLIFSKNACISKQDGSMWLMLRIGDMRKSHMIDAHTKAILVMDKVTEEGDYIPSFRHTLNMGISDMNHRLFLVWPVVVKHKISPGSPLWDITPDLLPQLRFELIVSFEGVMESSGMTVQARTSYLPDEILWGRRFKPMIPSVTQSGMFNFDYNNFHKTVVSAQTPYNSASDMRHRRHSAPDDNDGISVCDSSCMEPVPEIADSSITWTAETARSFLLKKRQLRFDDNGSSDSGVANLRNVRVTELERHQPNRAT